MLRIKTIAHYIYLLLLLLSTTVQAHANEILTKPATLVNDYSYVLSQTQLGTLEHRLVAFYDSTSNQIAIVITPTLDLTGNGDDDIMSVGQQIGESWGIGTKEYNNGLLIILKSKSSEEPNGDVAILTGYGLEGALPDVFCQRIIDDKMIPHLIEGDYYTALCEALDVILPVAAGEYSFAQYQEDDATDALIELIIVILIGVVIIYLIARHGKNHPGTGYGHGPIIGGPYWGSGFGSSGGFGGFSSGGFGGFGGGSFGGGGAHGSF